MPANRIRGQAGKMDKIRGQAGKNNNDGDRYFICSRWYKKVNKIPGPIVPLTLLYLL
jgi:hypothetical protein